MNELTRGRAYFWFIIDAAVAGDGNRRSSSHHPITLFPQLPDRQSERHPVAQSSNEDNYCG
ncbi:MAG TPA: hypothetical protein IGS17_12435 [Oscillatoriales cyanobacterium M59_W2019_021]|nr:hypothetical protein [Oscillatoriales cyanobacterium M4454_W2019_049]HIK51710.1 hypothetical protein [Oscillatoriales cyanobacterium M59_W2019_021]